MQFSVRFATILTFLQMERPNYKMEGEKIDVRMNDSCPVQRISLDPRSMTIPFVLIMMLSALVAQAMLEKGRH